MRMHYKKRDFARYLRKDQTNTEQIVWELLRNRKCNGLKFRRQHVVEGFVVDFYCDKYKLAIELDGSVHNRRKDYDELRDVEIGSKNIYIIRIRNSEIEKNPQIVLMKIQRYLGVLNNAMATPSPSGRGGASPLRRRG